MCGGDVKVDSHQSRMRGEIAWRCKHCGEVFPEEELCAPWNEWEEDPPPLPPSPSLDSRRARRVDPRGCGILAEAAVIAVGLAAALAVVWLVK
jgi:hypothetical protein